MDSFSPKWVHLNGFALWAAEGIPISAFGSSISHLQHLVQQYEFPTLFVTMGSNYTRKGLLTPVVLLSAPKHQRVLRVNSVFQSKNIITLPARLKKWRVWNAHGWTGTFLGALRPRGQGNSDTSLHTPLRRDAWSLSAPQKARQAWLHAVFGSFSAARQVDATRRDELSVKTELEVFVCVDPNTFPLTNARINRL